MTFALLITHHNISVQGYQFLIHDNIYGYRFYSTLQNATLWGPFFISFFSFHLTVSRCPIIITTQIMIVVRIIITSSHTIITLFSFSGDLFKLDNCTFFLHDCCSSIFGRCFSCSWFKFRDLNSVRSALNLYFEGGYLSPILWPIQDGWETPIQPPTKRHRPMRWLPLTHPVTTWSHDTMNMLSLKLTIFPFVVSTYHFTFNRC